MGKDLRFTGDNAWMGSYIGKGDEGKLHKHLQERYNIKKPFTTKLDNANYEEALESRRGYKDAINRAVNNDYDVRRTLEAKALAGDEEARNFAKGGIKGIQEVSDVHTMFKKDHEALGNSGDDFGSQSDYSQITMSAVDKDRKKQDDFFNKKLEELKAGMKTDEEPTVDETADVDIEESADYTAAKKRLEESESNIATSSASLFKGQAPTESPTTSFRKANESAPTSNDQQEAAASYLSDYKADVAEGAGLKAAPSNLDNAVKTVTGSTKLDYKYVNK